jgi:hypothetical protein
MAQTIAECNRVFWRFLAAALAAAAAGASEAMPAARHPAPHGERRRLGAPRRKLGLACGLRHL